VNDKSSYLGNSNLKAAGVEVQFTEEQVTEYMKCVQDPIYFIKNYIQIVSLDEGLVPFELYDYQENMVNSIHNNRFVIAKLPRQSGKSTTVIAYLLHYVLFNPQVSVAVLANKQATARELLHRLKLAYEYLPKWLQQGIVEWNKGNISLENGSKVLASSTSASAVRGGSFNMIFLDEFAYVPENVADEFFSSVYPTISSGKETKVLIISTPKGLNMYYKLWRDAEEGNNSYVPIEVHWSEVPGRDEKWKKETIRNTSESQFRAEFECEFIGSQNTLISPHKLKCLAYRKPIKARDDGLKMYYESEQNHRYFMAVDVSRGKEIDYHAITVIDITEMPYRIVATYRNNSLAPMLLPTVVNAVGKIYNDAYCMVEINDIGGQVSDILYNEFEYENLLVTSVRGRKGQTMDGGFGSFQTQLGVKTSSMVKKVGCSLLKDLIEEDKLLIEDYDCIQELTAFVARKGSYEAETGHHDDLVMTMVIFAWCTSQNYFKELTDLDIRTKLYQDKMAQIEEDLAPFGFIDDGFMDNTFVDQEGNRWNVVDDSDNPEW
jgi:hypothetical protein